GTLHFIDSAIGFELRLLHDYCPIKRGYWTVSAEHLNVVPALVDREFFSRCQLRLVALVHKVVDDLQVLHVLAGHILRSARRYQPALSIHDIRNQAAAADFLKTANQELQI